MNPKIVSGVLITKHNIIHLNDVSAIESSSTSSIVFHLRTTCKTAITINQECQFIWQLLTDYYNWELDDNN